MVVVVVFVRSTTFCLDSLLELAKDNEFVVVFVGSFVETRLGLSLYVFLLFFMMVGRMCVLSWPPVWQGKDRVIRNIPSFF